MSDLKYEPPTEEGLYQSGAQVWELGDDGFWSEVHGDGAEFGDHPFVRLVPEIDLTSDAVIEAVAKAIHDDTYRRGAWDDYDTWQTDTDSQHALFRERARAALAALREVS